MSSRTLHHDWTSGTQRHTAVRALAMLILIAGCTGNLATAQTFSTLHSFNGADGSVPVNRPVLDSSGNLYGVTQRGGASDCGTVFKLDATQTETVLYSFACGSDGNLSPNSLILEVAGGLAGTAAAVVFQVDSNGNETVLHTFTGADGSSPNSLVQDGAGNFLGTTHQGGDSGAGVVFKLDSSGTFTVLHSFTGSTDGRFPMTAVVDADANFYGITAIGGQSGCGYARTGCGVVFRIDTSGQFSVLHTFTGYDGYIPTSLLEDGQGNLYGTTAEGGNPACCGVIFKLDSSRHYTGLYAFPGGASGSHPNSLVRDTAGNLFGTTTQGGDPTCNCGVLFKLDTGGTLSVLHAFTGAGDHDGVTPGGLAQDSAGNFVGTANSGGDHGAGTIFKLTFNDFSLAASAFAPNKVSPGSSATSTVNSTAIGTFAGSVTLSCSVDPTPQLAPQCSVSPGSITPGTPATLTVTTTAPRAFHSNSSSGVFYAAWLPLLGWVSADAARRRKRVATLLGCLLFTTLLFQAACGGGGSSNGGGGGGTPGTPAGTYTITVTGVDTSGTLQHSATATLTVQ